MSLDYAVVNEIAAELGIAPAFVEKDWYSVQVLKSIAECQSNSIETLFAGGTSLSKAYGVIQRFSEDLDFRCRYIQPTTENQNKKMRSAYRSDVLEHIGAIADIALDLETVAVASNYIKFPLVYPQQYDAHRSLRSNLEVEFSFTQPRLAPQRRSIQSFVSLFTGSPAETEILCLSPVETGADKLSALTWRVLKRDRSAVKDDPTMIRHLHDLCALDSIISEEKDLFINTAHAAFNGDQNSKSREVKMELYPSLQLALAQLKNDKLYQQEYQQFVDAMSYADDDNTTNFDRAITSFEAMTSWFAGL